MCRQRKVPLESVQGLLMSMGETGVRTVRLGATQRFKEGAAAADEVVPGGTTRLAKVDGDRAQEANTPSLDVVLSEPLHYMFLCFLCLTL